MQGTVSKSTGLLLTDILQLVCHTSQTGCLHLINRSEGIPATINICAGALLNARYGDKRDADALAEIFNCSEWEFELSPKILDAEARLGESWTASTMRKLIPPDNARGPASPAADADRAEWRPQLLDYVLDGRGIRGGFSEEDASLLAEDLSFFQTAANLLASRLGEQGVREVGVTENGQTMAFHFGVGATHAAVGINADMESTVARVRKIAAAPPREP